MGKRTSSNYEGTKCQDRKEKAMLPQPNTRSYIKSRSVKITILSINLKTEENCTFIFNLASARCEDLTSH